MNKITCFSDIRDKRYACTLKKGEAEDPDNYRGIAIGSALGKIFSLIILDREPVVQISHPISPNQIGFKKDIVLKSMSKVFALEGILKRTHASFTPFLSGFLQIEETKM